MQVAELTEHGVPSFVVDRLQEKGIEALNPPQQDAVEAGLLDGESLVVSSPTASGKTLIATLAIAKLLRETDKKALYLVPLKALGSEKYQDYKEFFEAGDSDRSSGGGQSANNADVALSVGDKDTSDQWIETKDLIIMTTEKLDAVLRHNPSWIAQVGLVVVDEIHLLNSEGRGPTLEVTLTRLRDLLDVQLLGLSATIQNEEELADWLDCSLVSSDYRPVTLKEGVYHNGEIQFYSGEAPERDGSFTRGTDAVTETVEAEDVRELAQLGDATRDVVQDTLNHGHQSITFVRSRKSAESEAEQQGKTVKQRLSRDETMELAELAENVKTVLGSPTTQCRRLSRCVETGTAFHHAGLLPRQRSLVEDAFRSGLIKTIAATPTLAAGVSLPAYRIIIRDVKRYTDSGLNFIPVLEYKQMAGRAGRPEHHAEGQAITVAKKPGQVEEVRDRYVLGSPEKIYSKLAVEPVLRMHALGLIATRYVSDFPGLASFFEKTFYAHQYSDMEEVERKLQTVVEKLDEYGFVTVEEDRVRPTEIGKRVAELYIDPATAHHLLTGMDRARGQENVPDIALLQLLCETVEMKPRLRVRKREVADVEDVLAEVEHRLLVDVPQAWDDLRYETLLESMKTAMMLKEWVNEVEEDELMDTYTVTPGGIRAKVEQADWLLYAATELCTLKEWPGIRNRMKQLRTRIKHGIMEELLPLVRFKGIGRVRARKLHDAGITATSDIREASFNRLKNRIGKRTAEKLKRQVGQDNVFDKENILDYMEQSE